MLESDPHFCLEILKDDSTSVEESLNHLLAVLKVKRADCSLAVEKRMPDDIDVPTAILGYCFKSLHSLNLAILHADLRSSLEAYSKLQFFHGWAVGAIDDKKHRSQKMSEFGTRAHAEDHRIRDEIVARYQELVPPNTSIEKAADLLNTHFPHVAHRTIAKHISAARKNSKLPPAS